MPRLTAFQNKLRFSGLKKAAPLALLVSLCVHADTQATVSAPAPKNFGQILANGSTPATFALSFTMTGVAAPIFSLKYGVDYQAASPNCSGSGTVSCTLTVNFLPRQPGLRQDALLVSDSAGNLLATTLLYGVGMAPQIAIYPGVISTVAGKGSWGNSGDNGLATAATFRNPQGIAVDNAGNLYIADSVNQVIREVSATTGLISTIAGNGLGGYWGDGGKATQAGLNNPSGIALDGAGNIYLADQGNSRVRRIDAKTKIITTVAGGGGISGSDGLGDGGLATNALLNGPADVAVDGAGNIFVADSWHGLIRKVDASTGIISVVAGGGTSNGTDGFGDNGPAVQASLNNPSGVTLDGAGNLYISDTGHSLVRRVDSNGNITAVAGNGRSGYSGDAGPASKASLGSPYGVRVDPAGNIYIADQATSTLREVNALTGTIMTIAGTGAQQYLGDGGAPTNAALSNPTGVALSSSGDIFIADFSNNVIRKITLNGVPLTFPATLVGEVSDFQAVKVLNTGNRPLAFNGLTLSSNFTQQSLGGIDCSASSVVPSAGTCSVGIRFVPGTSGPLTGALTIVHNALNTPGSSVGAVLKGTGTSGTALPQISFAPASLAFGMQAVGSPSAPQVITLSNLGTGSLNLSSIQLGGANGSDFTFSSNCQNILAGGSHCSLSVVFSPTATGSRAASLTLVDNLATSPQTFSMTGTAGQPQIALSATTLSFGSQSFGTTSAPQTLGISNTGSAPLNVAGLSVGGANASDFNMSSTCGSSVSGSTSCSLAITFSPHAAGNRTASITLATNGAGGTQIIVLSGNTAAQVQPAVWGPWNGTWYYAQGTNPTPAAAQWGLPGDIPVPGDYDGDGKTDLAIFRPADRSWWIVGSRTSTAYTLVWGLPGDVPVPGDYDGDGKTDIAVFRPSDRSWWIIGSRTSTAYTLVWVLQGDVPMPGDYDGDGKTDIAVFRPSDRSWWIISSRTSAAYTLVWGLPGDVPVPGDYDGDGKTDIAVFRPSDRSWWIIGSRTSAAYTLVWGLQGDVPVPGDYDGDGKTDVAIFRPSNSTWWVMNSKTGTSSVTQLGASGDTPIRGFSKR